MIPPEFCCGEFMATLSRGIGGWKERTNWSPRVGEYLLTVVEEKNNPISWTLQLHCSESGWGIRSDIALLGNSRERRDEIIVV